MLLSFQVVKVLHITDEDLEENANDKKWNPDYAKLIDSKSKELEPMLQAEERNEEGFD